MMTADILLLLSLFVSLNNAFSLPGVTPTTYHTGDAIPLLVNHLTPSQQFHHINSEGDTVSGDAQHYMYSYDYYYPKFHFCQPQNIRKEPESLGSFLFGDRIYNSPFELNMLDNKECVKLCSTSIPKEDSQFINSLIKSGFKQNWIVDGLPAGNGVLRSDDDQDDEEQKYLVGFPLGFVDVIDGWDAQQNPNRERDSKASQNKIIELPYFANHFEIEIHYHKIESNAHRVVGFVVTPYSIKDNSETCILDGERLVLSEKGDTEVSFTYSVKYMHFAQTWATRWDQYAYGFDSKIEWVSLLNCSGVVIALSAVVVHMLMRALKKDFARYNELNLDNQFQEDSGWKLCHGDVFRIPNRPLLLSVLIGSGTQLFLMVICSVILATIGFANSQSRGTLPTVMFILYALFGSIGSYTSMGVYKFFKGPYWKVNMILTPILVPGSVFLIIVGLNTFLAFVHSSGVIPLGTLITVIVLWLILSVPLSLAGSLIAHKKCSWDHHPTKTNQIFRQIPFEPWYMKTIPAALLAGFFPFTSIAVELYFIYTSLWYNQFFYMFGFVLFSFFLLVMTTALVTVLITYNSLCLENWKWQWKSFIVGGLGCATYVFIHAILFTKFELRGFVTIVLYVGYSALISILCCIITGTVGFFTSMLFVKRIYSSIKVD